MIIKIDPVKAAAILAKNETAASEKAAQMAIKEDAFVKAFISMTPADVADYVETNVKDMASAKELLKRMALMMLYLAKREYK